ncbi:MAG: cupredoxin domain-containing protein [Gemmatimonadota bacterium]
MDRPHQPTCRPRRHVRVGFLLLALVVAACSPEANKPYRPVTRDVTLTAVPLLTKEMAAVYPFLKEDFAKGGVLDGKEVYAFTPNSITAYAGDTLAITLVNPEDDEHSFVLPDRYVKMPGMSVTHTTYVVDRPGIIRIICAIPKHMPYMWGEIVVLPDKLAYAAADSAA